MSKVAIIGAGNVGGTAGMWIAAMGLANIVLLDKDEGKAHGKAMDINDALSIFSSNCWVEGTSDYDSLSECKIIVITAGIARRPGMTRDDLLKKNIDVLKTIITTSQKNVSKDTIWIFVTNPVDIITTYAYRLLKIDRHKIMGMGVNLDSSRMINQLAKNLNLARSSIKAMVIGRHGKGMSPLVNNISLNGSSLELTEKEKNIILEKTINRGSEIVAAFKNGSAYVAPGAAIYQIVKAILTNSKEVLPLSVPLEGEYNNVFDVAIGVPVKLNKSGWESVVPLAIPEDILNSIRESSEKIKLLLSQIG